MKIIEIIADPGHVDTLKGIAEQHEINDCWQVAGDSEDRAVIRMLVSDARRQGVIDALQSLLGSSEHAHILIQPVEAVLPRSSEVVGEKDGESASTGQTREELYNEIVQGAQLDNTFLLLVCLSTIVASIGLIENNIAVVVGAMVIAPLLGPNIALAFATALGDARLAWRALRTTLAGFGLTLLMSIATGVLWPERLHSSEILARTDVGMAGITLAMASGAAAVLSLITGLSSTLVGVMVAVALLPPAATLGMMLGSGQYSQAAGAGLLLAVNVVCINLSAKLMFWIKGIKPRTWLERSKARQSFTISMLFWVISLALLIAAIVLRHRVTD